MKPAVLGYAAAALEGAAVAKARRRQLPAWKRQLQQRIRSLTRLAQLRRVERRHPGEETGWIIVLANVAGVKFGRVDTVSMLNLATTIGTPAIDERSLAAVVGEVSGRRKRLLSAAQCGALVGLSTDERGRLCIKDIDATDEPAADRKRRLARQRQARRRAGAALKGAARKPSIEEEKPWAKAGISRRTWYRNRAKSGGGTECVTRPYKKNNYSSEDIARARIGAASNSVTAAVPSTQGDVTNVD